MRRSLVIIAMIIPTIVGLMKIYDWFGPKGADVVAFVEVEDSLDNQPKATRDLLSLLESLRSEAGASERLGTGLSALADVIRKEFQHSPHHVDQYGRDLFEEGIKVFADLEEHSTPRIWYSSLYKVHVINRGTHIAKNIKITLSSAAFFEIWPEGRSDQPLSSGRADRQITIETLQAEDNVFVYLWFGEDKSTPSGTFSVLDAFDCDQCQIKAAFDDGRIPVESGSVSRTGYNYVVGVPRLAIPSVVIALFVLTATGMVLIRGRKLTRKAVAGRGSRVHSDITTDDDSPVE